MLPLLLLLLAAAPAPLAHGAVEWGLVTASNADTPLELGVLPKLVPPADQTQEDQALGLHTTSAAVSPRGVICVGSAHDDDYQGVDGSGAVFVFAATDPDNFAAQWVMTQKIRPPAGALAGNGFGVKVTMHTGDSLMVVASEAENDCYIYELQPDDCRGVECSFVLRHTLPRYALYTSWCALSPDAEVAMVGDISISDHNGAFFPYQRGATITDWTGPSDTLSPVIGSSFVYYGAYGVFAGDFQFVAIHARHCGTGCGAIIVHTADSPARTTWTISQVILPEAQDGGETWLFPRGMEVAASGDLLAAGASNGFYVYARSGGLVGSWSMVVRQEVWSSGVIVGGIALDPSGTRLLWAVSSGMPIEDDPKVSGGVVVVVDSQADGTWKQAGVLVSPDSSDYIGDRVGGALAVNGALAVATAAGDSVHVSGDGSVLAAIIPQQPGSATTAQVAGPRTNMFATDNVFWERCTDLSVVTSLPDGRLVHATGASGDDVDGTDAGAVVVATSSAKGGAGSHHGASRLTSTWDEQVLRPSSGAAAAAYFGAALSLATCLGADEADAADDTVALAVGAMGSERVFLFTADANEDPLSFTQAQMIPAPAWSTSAYGFDVELRCTPASASAFGANVARNVLAVSDLDGGSLDLYESASADPSSTWSPVQFITDAATPLDSGAGIANFAYDSAVVQTPSRLLVVASIAWAAHPRAYMFWPDDDGALSGSWSNTYVTLSSTEQEAFACDAVYSPDGHGTMAVVAGRSRHAFKGDGGGAWVLAPNDPEDVTSGWLEIQMLACSDYFHGGGLGYALAVSKDARVITVSMPNVPPAGKVYVFTRRDNDPTLAMTPGDEPWIESAVLRPVGAATKSGGNRRVGFGASLDFSADGALAVAELIEDEGTATTEVRGHVVDPPGVFYATNASVRDGVPPLTDALLTAGCFSTDFSKCMPVFLNTGDYTLPNAEVVAQTFMAGVYRADAAAYGPGVARIITSASARALTASGVPLVLQDLAFLGTHDADAPAGAVVDEGGLALVVAPSGTADLVGIRIARCSFTQGVARRGGALFVNGGVELTVTDSYFAHNAAATGGALYVSDGGATATITNTIMENNHATTSSGGAVYLDAASVSLGGADGGDGDGPGGGGALPTTAEGIASARTAGTIVRDNTAQAQGGGVFCGVLGSFEARQVLFERNTAGSGGAVALSESTGTLEHCACVNNTARAHGGCAFASRAPAGVDVTTFARCALHGNSAAAGGAVAASGTSVAVHQSSARWNVADHDGGALSLIGVQSAGDANAAVESTVADSLLSDGAAGRRGGAVFCDGCVAALSNATLRDNVAHGDSYVAGGAVACSGTGSHDATTYVSVSNSTVHRNAATAPFGASGGGMAAITVAGGGGGLAADAGCSLVLNASVVATNTAVSMGAGVSCDDCSLTLAGGSVLANSVTQEVAPVAAMDHVVLAATRVSDYLADDALGGGGVCVHTRAGSSAASSIDASTSFSGNVAPRGGAILVVGEADNATCADDAQACIADVSWRSVTTVSVAASVLETLHASDQADRNIGTIDYQYSGTRPFGADVFWKHQPPLVPGASAAHAGAEMGSGASLASAALSLQLVGSAPTVVQSGMAMPAFTVRCVDAYGRAARADAGTVARVVARGDETALIGTTIVAFQDVDPANVTLNTEGPVAVFEGTSALAKPGSTLAVRIVLDPHGGVAPLDLDLPVDLCGAGSQMTRDERGCDACDAGSHAPSANANATACIPCSPGSYAPQSGASACAAPLVGYVAVGHGASTQDKCGPGTAPNADSSLCSICGPGTASAGGQAECTPCPAGSAPDGSRAECVPCSNAQSSNGTACVACDINHVRDPDDAARCSHCLPGYTRAVDETRCVACQAGWALLDGDVECSECQPGTWQSEEGSTECDTASPGRIASTARATAEVACNVGDEPNADHTACVPCAAGHASRGGAVDAQCTPCPDGSAPDRSRAECVPCSNAQSSNGTACVACDINHVRDVFDAARCVPCPVGQVRDALEVCTPCDSGSVLLPGALHCSECAVGSYQQFPGMTECNVPTAGYATITPGTGAQGQTACPRGSVPAPALNGCEDCPEGTFQPLVAPQGKCLAPDPGHIVPPSESPGASAQVECAAGTYKASDTECTPCVEGEASEAGSDACAPCAGGSRPVDGVCAPCDLGTAAAHDGSRQCEPCAPGSYADAVGLRTCVECPVGSFGANERATSAAECTPCPDGTTTAGVGASSSLECVAQAGRISLMGMAAANALGMDTTAGSQDAAAADCPVGALCDAPGTTLASLQLAPGFWRATKDTLNVRRCAHEDWCLGGAFQESAASMCAPLHTGAYCAACAEGAYMTMSGCLPCSESSTSQAAMAIVVCLVLVALIAACHRFLRDPQKPRRVAPEPGSPHSTVAKSGAGGSQSGPGNGAGDVPGKANSGGVAEASDSDSDSNVGGGGGSSSRPPGSRGADAHGAADSALHSSYVAGQVLYHTNGDGRTHVAAGTHSLSQATHAHEAEEHLEHEAELIERERTALDMMSGGDPADTTTTPTAHANDIASSTRFAKAVSTTIKDPLQKAKILLSTLQFFLSFRVTLDVQYPAVYHDFLDAIAVFSFKVTEWVSFGCVGRDHYVDLLAMTLGPIAVAAPLYLVAVYGPARVKPKLQAILILLSYTLYTPVCTTIFATLPCEAFEDGSNVLVADVSIDCNAPERTAWLLYVAVCIVVYACGIPTTYFVLLYRQRHLLNPSVALNGVHPGDDDYEDEVIAYRMKHPDLRWCQSLVSPFAPKYWWFEVLIAINKVVLTGFIAFAAPGTSSQVLFALLVVLTSMYITSETRPFLDPTDDQLSMLAYLQLVFSLVLALAIKAGTADEEGYNDNVLGALLILAVLIVAVVGTFALLYGVFVSTPRVSAIREEHPRIPFMSRHFFALLRNRPHDVPPDCACAECVRQVRRAHAKTDKLAGAGAGVRVGVRGEDTGAASAIAPSAPKAPLADVDAAAHPAAKAVDPAGVAVGSTPLADARIGSIVSRFVAHRDSAGRLEDRNHCVADVLTIGDEGGLLALGLAARAFTVAVVDTTAASVAAATHASDAAGGSDPTRRLVAAARGDARDLGAAWEPLQRPGVIRDAVVALSRPALSVAAFASRAARAAALAEMHRCLCVGGTLLVQGVNSFETLLGNAAATGGNGAGAGSETSPLVTPEQLSAEVEAAGFTVHTVVAVEGPAAVLSGRLAKVDSNSAAAVATPTMASTSTCASGGPGAGSPALLSWLLKVEAQTSVLAVTPSFVVVARKPSEASVGAGAAAPA